MTNTNIDYINTHFEYQTLTRIHGQPSHPSLKIIKDEMKVNASSITSNFGGGANGNLGLVLTQPEYTFVSTTNYVRPVHLDPLVIPPATSQHESMRLRKNHKEAIRVYCEMISVKQCFTKKLGQALPECYLRSFRIIHTNTITIEILTLLEHLFTTYGSIEWEELQEKVDKLRHRVFDISQPLITMYNDVNKQQDLATASGNPLPPNSQLK